MKIENGNKIKVEYEGRLEDGTVFDSSKNHGQALEFEVGAHQVIPGFEEGVVGMAVNEEKEINISVEKAYGPRREELFKEVPKDQLPEGEEPKVGMMLGVGLPNGQQVPATITEVNEKSIKIDLNSPLAGKALIFKVKVLEIK
jgi:FKBP-type peptidyl-prolyl cis-trans isomerase 2